MTKMISERLAVLETKIIFLQKLVWISIGADVCINVLPEAWPPVLAVFMGLF